MLNRLSILLRSTLVLSLLFVPVYALAGPKAAQYLGEPESCIDVYRIKETRILDNQTILFIMHGEIRYLNRLPIRCTGLVLGNGFAYSTTIQKLCLQDSIKVLNTGAAIGNTCPLGRFIPFKADMGDNDAVKLLKEGLLDELVSEGVFEEAFK